MQAQCNGTARYNSFTAAWDFLNTSGPFGLQASIYYNQTFPPKSPPPLYRLPGLLNAAVRGWAKTSFSTETELGSIGKGTIQPHHQSVELLGLMSFPKGTTTLNFDL